MNVKPENLRHQPLKHKFNPVLSWRTFWLASALLAFDPSQQNASGHLILTRRLQPAQATEVTLIGC
ncbi:hypothetical protein DEO15_23110 [Escherichia coli]|nr:hypothetical protein AWA97_25930 [Escherichia coli O104:H21 str. CFSAN002236]TFW92499.1 hypothetical protein DEO15_23110 [Escherichia coli]TFX98420.1 hypothetical protein DEN94_23485 [Escherichia coli]TFY15841.1 hypothetical protein DEN93_17460 [Escherichia coli]